MAEAAVREMVRSMGAEQLDSAIRFATFELVGRDILLDDMLRLCDQQDLRRGTGEVDDGHPISDSSEEESVVDLLRALLAVPMTFETLEKTKIGKTITGLTKHSSEQVRGLAGELYKNWRDLVNEHLTTRSKPTTKTASVPLVVADHTKANTAAAHKHKVAPAPTKTTASALAAAAHRAVQATAAMKKTASNNKRKEAPAMMPEMEDAKLEAATKKLREGYREAETTKKQRKIQMINAPPGKVKPRFVVVERRAPVIGMARCR